MRRYSTVLTLMACFVLLCCLNLATATRATAAPTAEQRKQVSRIDSLISKAGNLFRDKKFQESSEAIKEAQELMENLAGSSGKDVLPLLDDSFRKLQKAHGLLELEGITLPELKKPADMIGSKPAGGAAPPAGAITFTGSIAPLLIAKCGRCHVNDNKGMFSIGNYDELMKGPKEGKVVFPGDADGSRLVEVIVSGDMPRGGLKVSPEELAILKQWIMDGAKFDGPADKTKESLSKLVPDAKPADAPTLQVMKSTGNETVSFSNELAGVLANQCGGCHGTMRPRENFSLATFQALLKGGDSGPPIVPGNPEESLLVKKLKGTGGGQRMPQGKPPLEDAFIAKIETWIKEGATFDSSDPAMNLARVAALSKALRATHEELAEDRGRLASDNWRLAMPTAEPTKFESKNFLLYGNVGPNSLTEVADVAESVTPRIATFFKADSDAPLLKGRMTIFVFGQRYDYTEFGQMVEKRELPKEWKAHWQFDILDAYAAMLMPRSKDDAMEALLGHQIASAYVASLGDIPRWFSEGCGRMAAAKIDAADKRVVATNEAIPEAISTSTKPDDFLTGKLSMELRDVASYSFVCFLVQKNPKSFDQLLDALRKGTDFEKAFTATYRATPNQVAEAWAKQPASIKGKSGARTNKKS